jgi:hypothetical protein
MEWTKGGFVSPKSFMSSVVVVGLLAAISGCSSAVPTETPGVERLGEYVLREKGVDTELVLGYKFASMSLGNEWMILEIAVSSPPGKTARIERKNVSLRTPDGIQIPVATQQEFGKAYSGLRSFITKANVARDPLDYFPPSREDCAVQFFVAPGEGVAYDQVTVNDRRVCQGRLFFNIPGGIQPGRWVLSIDLEESEVRIPFTLVGPRP